MEIKLAKLFEKQTLLIFDDNTLSLEDQFQPFAYTDVLVGHVGATRQPCLHFWELEKTVILGMKDTRITDLAKGINLISKRGYNTLARNSGGLAVVADKGVLNVSLFIPSAEESPLSIIESYQVLTELVRKSFADYQMEIIAKEVPDSYCPGEFDLSIREQKFAGIAQRRIRNGVAIMLYISVNGNQQMRGDLIEDFYHVALDSSFGELGYPPVNPDVMANLTDLLDPSLTIPIVKERILNALAPLMTEQPIFQSFPDFIEKQGLEKDFDKQLTKMIQRNSGLEEMKKMTNHDKVERRTL